MSTTLHKNTTALYAGSFDPPTIGHAWIIEEGAALFGKLEVAIGTNPDKQSMFTLDQKKLMLQKITEPLQNVTIKDYENQFLANYAANNSFDCILRGMRSREDFIYERELQSAVHNVNANIRFVYLIPPDALAHISSSVIRKMIKERVNPELLRAFLPDALVDIVAAINL